MKKSKSLMKIAFAMCFTFLLSSCRNTSDNAEIESLKAEIESLKATSVETTRETITQATMPQGTYKGCTAVLEGATIVSDYKGDPAVIVEITFTNNSDENKACGYTFKIDAFQDGVECETAIVTDYDEFDTGTNVTKIKPGVQLTVYKAYELRNESSDVVVEVSGLYDRDDKIISECTYHIK